MKSLSKRTVEYLHTLYPEHMRYAEYAIHHNAFHHAYCFAGSTQDGGQESMALAWAALLLCERVGTQDAPCGTCNQCSLLAERRHPDVLTITPTAEKQSIDIEAARRIRKHFSVRPTVSQKKIVILSSVERMNMSCANALLKTIEEPPAYGIVLCTTSNAQQLPATIRSRMHLLRIPPIPQKILNSLLTEYAQKESLSEEERTLLAQWIDCRGDRLIDLCTQQHQQQFDSWKEGRAFWKAFLDQPLPERDAGLSKRLAKLSEPEKQQELGRAIPLLQSILYDTYVQRTLGDNINRITEYSEKLRHVQLVERYYAQRVNTKMIYDYLTISL